MNTQRKGSLLTGTTLALAAFCAPIPARAASPPPRAPRTVTITNTRSQPVEVYLQRDADPVDTRLGKVKANGEATLRVPDYVTAGADARIFVEPEKGLELASPEITMPAAGSLDVLVTPNNVGWVPEPKVVLPDVDASRATLTVSNPRDDAVDVILEYGDFDVTLGTVQPNQLQTFDIPERMTRDDAEVQLFLHPKEGIDLSSQFLTLHPRSHLEVVVPTHGEDLR